MKWYVLSVEDLIEFGIWLKIVPYCLRTYDRGCWFDFSVECHRHHDLRYFSIVNISTFGVVVT